MCAKIYCALPRGIKNKIKFQIQVLKLILEGRNTNSNDCYCISNVTLCAVFKTECWVEGFGHRVWTQQ